MGIVNAGQIVVYQEIHPELLEKVEDGYQYPSGIGRLAERRAAL